MPRGSPCGCGRAGLVRYGHETVPSRAPIDATTPTFGGTALDRASARRADPDWIAQRLADPASRTVAVSGDGVLLDGGAEPHLLRAMLPEPASVLLGLEDGRALFAVDLDELDEPARGAIAPGGQLVGLRDAGAVLPIAEGGLAAYAVALLGWHRRHRFCANCGTRTEVAEAGYSRHCPNCGATHFPRTDPVVIVVVEHDGRLLLGRQPRWPERRYSLLAGFIAAGETAEEAVAREVFEESGIRVHDPCYVASQPWPFPASLMLGFRARGDGGEPRPRDAELQDVRWFEIEEVRRAAAGEPTELLLPPPVSIARFLIERRLAGRL